MNAMNAYIIKKASNKHPDVYSTSSNYHPFVELNNQKIQISKNHYVAISAEQPSESIDFIEENVSYIELV